MARTKPSIARCGCVLGSRLVHGSCILRYSEHPWQGTWHALNQHTCCDVWRHENLTPVPPQHHGNEPATGHAVSPLICERVSCCVGTPLSELSTRAAMVTTLQAMAAATANSTPLPGPCYHLCFPVLEAVLSSSLHTPLHEQALQVMALHVAPGLPLPRKQTLAVLYHVLGVVPAYRSVIQACCPGLMLACSGVDALKVLDKGFLLTMAFECFVTFSNFVSVADSVVSAVCCTVISSLTVLD